MPATGTGGGDTAAAPFSSRLGYQDDSRTSSALTQDKAAAVERLGMGMGRLGFGADGTSATTPAGSTARPSTFGATGAAKSASTTSSSSSSSGRASQPVKAISSEQYFGRNGSQRMLRATWASGPRERVRADAVLIATRARSGAGAAGCGPDRSGFRHNNEPFLWSQEHFQVRRAQRIAAGGMPRVGG